MTFAEGQKLAHVANAPLPPVCLGAVVTSTDMVGLDRPYGLINQRLAQDGQKRSRVFTVGCLGILPS